MNIHVRVNGVLAEKLGRTRLSVTLAPPATIQDLVDHLQREHPHLVDELCRAVAVRSGAHQAETATLADGQEIALLLPIAGG